MTNYWPIIPTTSWLEVDTHREARREIGRWRGREKVCVCEREREGERERVCVCVCV